MDSDVHRSSLPANFRSGFVAIVGAPNAGKSTLLNQFLGEKVAITTPKPQTTRHQIKGILTGDGFQIVFLDTPGFHESRKLLNRLLIKETVNALEGVDVVLLVVDVTRRKRGKELGLLDLLSKVPKPVILVLNKVDKVARQTLLPIIDEIKDIHPFEAIIPVSAKYGSGVERVLEETLRLLSEGPQYYEGTMITDQSREEMVSEIIREKIFLFAEQEVPYSTAVKVEEIQDLPDKGLVRIRANIYVERASQKAIIIGKGGRFIKKVGRLARQELEYIWRKKVFIDLWVKVLKDWSRDERVLKDLGIGKT